MRVLESKRSWGCCLDVDSLTDNIHYIGKYFTDVVIYPREGDTARGVESVLGRYKGKVRIWIWVPGTVDVIDYDDEKYSSAMRYVEQLSDGVVSGLVFTLNEKGADIKYKFSHTFMKRVGVMLKRSGVRLLLANSAVKENDGLSVANLVQLSGVGGVGVVLDLGVSQAYGDMFIPALQQNGTLAGLGRIFDMVVLDGVDLGVKYSDADYVRFLKELRNIPVMYRGDLSDVIPAHERVLKLW